MKACFQMSQANSRPVALNFAKTGFQPATKVERAQVRRLDHDTTWKRTPPWQRRFHLRRSNYGRPLKRPPRFVLVATSKSSSVATCQPLLFPYTKKTVSTSAGAVKDLDGWHLSGQQTTKKNDGVQIRFAQWSRLVRSTCHKELGFC